MVRGAVPLDGETVVDLVFIALAFQASLDRVQEIHWCRNETSGPDHNVEFGTLHHARVIVMCEREVPDMTLRTFDPGYLAVREERH